MERKRIRKDRIHVNIGELAENGRSAHAFIQNVKAVLADFEKPEYFDATIEIDTDYEEPDRIYFVTFRDETDAEMAKRAEREKRGRERSKEARQKAKENQKLEDMREISRLAAKYNLKAVPK